MWSKWPFHSACQFRAMSQIMERFKRKFCLLVTIFSEIVSACLANCTQPAQAVQKWGLQQPHELFQRSVWEAWSLTPAWGSRQPPSLGLRARLPPPAGMSSCLWSLLWTWLMIHLTECFPCWLLNFPDYKKEALRRASESISSANYSWLNRSHVSCIGLAAMAIYK